MKWNRREQRVTPEPVTEPDEESVELELASLRHKMRQSLPSPDQKFHAPGPVDLDPHALEETPHTLDERVIDLHPREVEDYDPHQPRTLKSKLFGIAPSGYVQLGLISVGVGAVVQAGGLNPWQPGFTWQSALSSLSTGALNVLGWTLQSGWQPLLLGAAVVVPVWLAWRLLSVPFRH
jgi:uncharacterized protein DUF6460